MFTRLFKPKWEHPDPRARCEALGTGEVPSEVLARAAREDLDPAVRRCAVERLGDLELLATLVDTEPPGDLRETASRRQREVLAGPLAGGAPLAARLQAMANAASPELCEYLAREAQVAEIRIAALERVQDTIMLCAIAVDDPVSTVRRAALERIDDPQGWELVARDARNKDKQVSRMARERLEVYRKRQSEQETAERVCAELEALAEIIPGAGCRQQFLRLSSEWGQLEMRPAPVQERFDQARQQVATLIERYLAVQSERQALCTGLEDLAGSLSPSAGSGSVSVPEVRQRLREASTRWEELSPAAADDVPLSRRFAGLVSQLQGESERLDIDQARTVPLRALIQQADELLASVDVLDAEGVHDLEHRWEALERPVFPGLAKALQQEFASRRDLLRERLKGQAKQRRQALEEAEGLIAGMDHLLREGELERALSQRDRARHLLKIAAGSDDRKCAALQTRLQRLHPRLEQLRQWRHWGSGNARERLCAELESLADSVLPAAEIATRVRTAREAWKRIDRAEGPAREDLWQRFDQACTRAYAPYQQERRKQAERLAAHRAQKQALCTELDTFERDTDWKTVDWRAADRLVRTAGERWRRIGPVPARARKPLEKAYREVLARLESHLDTERERELRRRRALITRVEQLAAVPDLRDAIREVKEAQTGWSPSVSSAPEVEQTLWNAFRSACDAVFTQAKEERAAADTERQVNLDRKSALCSELEALLDRTEGDFHDLAHRFTAASSEWERIGTVPHKLERALEGRYEALMKRFAERRRQEARTAAQALLQGLRERSRLCERLERAVLVNSLSEVEREMLVTDTCRTWEALAALDAPRAQELRQRFDTACRALAGDAVARRDLLDALPRNLARRLELCLRMEIAAGLDSPAEFGEARLRLQVTRLADALSHRQDGARDGAGRLRELLIDWYLAGPAPLEANDALEARVARVSSGRADNAS
jgi:DNA repair protein SbcC/Rad50